MKLSTSRIPLFAALAVLLIDILLVGVFAVRFPQTMLVDNAIDLWFDQSDPTVDAFEREKALFEGGTWMIANVWAEDSEDATMAGLSADLTRALRQIDGVANVISPHNIDILQSDDEGLYYDRLPKEMSWTERRSWLLDHPVAADLVVHDDDSRLISFVLKELTDTSQSDTRRQQLVEEIRAVLHGEPRIDHAALVGAAVINAEMNRLSWHDFLILIPASSVVIVLLLVLLLRTHWRFGLGVVLSSSGATLATCCAMLSTGSPFNMLTIALPGVVFTLAVASSLHVLHHYLRSSATARSAQDNGWQTTRQLLRPIAVSHVTTALGFGLMIMMPVVPVDTMAIFGSLGVLWAGVHSALVTPQLLAALAPHRDTASARPFRGVEAATMTIRSYAARLDFLQDRRGVVAVVCGVSILMVGLMTTTLGVDSTYLRMVSKDENLRRDYATFEASGKASTQLSILVSKPAADGLIDPELNEALRIASARIEALAPVRKVVGPAAIFDEVSLPLADDQSLEAYSADTNAVTDAYIFALTGGNEEVVHYVEDSLEHFRLVVMFEYLSNSALRELVGNDIDGIVDETLGRIKGVSVEVSGLAVLWSNMDGAILRGQLVSILTIGFVCFAVFYLSTRRIRVSFIATLVNFMPMAAIAAVMGVTGMKLDLAAVFVLGLSLGIAIDDTSFFVHRYEARLSTWGDVRDAIDHALAATAPPMLATSVVIACGFALLLLSAFVPMRVFGGFTAMGVMFATVFDCFVLSLLLAVYDRRQERVPCSLPSPV